MVSKAFGCLGAARDVTAGLFPGQRVRAIGGTTRILAILSMNRQSRREERPFWAACPVCWRRWSADFSPQYCGERRTLGSFGGPLCVLTVLRDKSRAPRLCEAHQFMVPMHDHKTTEAFHEPAAAGPVRVKGFSGKRNESHQSFDMNCTLPPARNAAFRLPNRFSSICCSLKAAFQR